MSDLAFFDQKLLQKYNTNGPRYTSYPSALEFNTDFSNQDYVSALTSSCNKELSLYIHIPFCHSLCYYCGCNKIVTRHQHKTDLYLQYLAKEITSRAQQCHGKTVTQIHFGGGTPSFLTKPQLLKVVSFLKSQFSLSEQVEMSIEVDPRQIELDLADYLFSLGFNRLSIGVQDTDIEVQKAINRVQSFEFIEAFIQRAQNVGFGSVNIDLIYGLPHQTINSFTQSLLKIEKLNADRISLFSYAHLPERFSAQRKIKQHWLPNGQEKLALMELATTMLSQFGYKLIGMDHFAKADDELAIAQDKGELHRNFQGYTTNSNANLIGLGVSSISSVDQIFSQNHKHLKDYYQQIDLHCHGVEKGIKLSLDDIIRKKVISSLMCNLIVHKQQIESQFGINFDQYFAAETLNLKVFVDDSLITNHANSIEVLKPARLLIRNICMTFDAYMQNHIAKHRFSQVI